VPFEPDVPLLPTAPDEADVPEVPEDDDAPLVPVVPDVPKAPVRLTSQDVNVPLPSKKRGVTTITPVPELYETTRPII
jgi:hypothetical protein